MRSNLQFNIQTPEVVLEERIEEFKQDKEKMQEMNLFVDSLLVDASEKAQEQLDAKLAEEKAKTSLSLSAFKNKKYVVRARTYFRGIFDSISNCTANLPSLPVSRRT